MSGWQGLFTWADVKPCGTPAAYKRHYRHGEKPCRACRQAEALRKLSRREQARAAADRRAA